MEFAATVGFFLRHGFALRPTRSDAGSSTGFDALLSTLPAEVPISAGEQVCANLLNAGELKCFPMMVQDDGIHAVSAIVAQQFHCFFALNIPGVAMPRYAMHLVRGMCCSQEVLVNALVYIARAAARGVPLTPRSAHRMFLAAMVVAAKLRDDTYYQMSYYAQVGGVTRTEMIQLEAAMCDLLEFELHVSESEFAAMVYALRSMHSQANTPEVGTWATVVGTINLPIRCSHADCFAVAEPEMDDGAVPACVEESDSDSVVPADVEEECTSSKPTLNVYSANMSPCSSAEGEGILSPSFSDYDGASHVSSAIVAATQVDGVPPPRAYRRLENASTQQTTSLHPMPVMPIAF